MEVMHQFSTPKKPLPQFFMARCENLGVQSSVHACPEWWQRPSPSPPVWAWEGGHKEHSYPAESIWYNGLCGVKHIILVRVCQLVNNS